MTIKEQKEQPFGILDNPVSFGFESGDVIVASAHFNNAAPARLHIDGKAHVCVGHAAAPAGFDHACQFFQYRPRG